MERGTVGEIEGHLIKGRNSATAECRRTAMVEKMVRHCCLADGAPYDYRRHLQYEAQQRRGRELDRPQQHRQRKHLEQQKGHAFEQTWRHPHGQQKRRPSQQQTQQQERPHKQSQPQSRQQKEQQPTLQHLPQEGHVLRQFKHEGRYPARLLLALLLLVLPRVPVQRSSAELSCGVFLVSLPASGGVAAAEACASLPRTEKKLAPSPIRTNRAAAAAGAAARRLADEKGVRGDPPERVERHAAGAQREAGQETVQKLSPVTDPQEGRRGARDAASPARPEGEGIQWAKRINASSKAEMKGGAEMATQRTYPEKPSAATAEKKVETSAAYESGDLASTAYGGTAYAAEDNGAGEGKREGEKAKGISRSHGAATPTGSAWAGKGMAEASRNDVASGVIKASQQFAARGSLQMKTAASVDERTGRATNVQQPPTPSETKQERQHPPPHNRVAGLHVPGTGSAMPVEAHTPPWGASSNSSSLQHPSDRTHSSKSGSRTSADSNSPKLESASSSPGRPPAGPPEDAEMGAPVRGGLLPLRSSSPDSVVASTALETPASSLDATAIAAAPDSVKSSTSLPTGTAAGAQLPGGSGTAEELSSSEPLRAQVATATGAAGETAEKPVVDILAAGGIAAESARQAPTEPAAKDPCMLRQRLVEQRVAALEEQTRSAEKLIQVAADEQQRLFAAFEQRVQAVDEQLAAVQMEIDELNKMLANVGERLASERDRQQAMFHEDLQRSIDAVGLNSAALRQAELSGKVNALHGMHDTLSDKMKSLAQSLQEMEENRQARLEVETQKLKKFVEGRTSLAIAQLVTDAKHCAAGMQQQLNDAKLDQILLAQAAKEAEERLREQRFAAVDISHVDESMSFQGITSAFAALVQATFPRKELVVIYFVIVRPQTLASAAYANVFLVPSAENTRRLLSVVAADPSLSEMVVKVESIMAEAWRISPQRAHLQYLMPTPQEGLHMAGSVEYVYEFMKTMHKVTQEQYVNGETSESRHGILVYTGLRRGVEAPADTPYTEFKKLQILRNLVTMYTSPVQETGRLWQIMKNEVQLLDIFAPLQPIEVDGCHLRVYGGVAPFPEIPNSPFFKGGVMFVRLELTRSGTRYYLFPNPGLWLKILQYLSLVDRTNMGTFAVIKARLTKVSWIRSRILRLLQSVPTAELSVHVHGYHRTTQPSELQAAEMKGSQGKPEGASSASSEFHKGLAEAVESITDTLAQSVLPYTARKGFTTPRHLFVHVCESDVSCGTQEAP